MQLSTRIHLLAELRRLEAQGRNLDTMGFVIHEKDDPVALAVHTARRERHAAEWAAFREVRIAFERECGPLELMGAGLTDAKIPA